MKKLTFLFILILGITMISCNNSDFKASSPIITEQAFIDNLNAFDTNARYDYVDCQDSSFIFVIKENDSLFIYNVEKTEYTRHLINTTIKNSLVK